MAMATISGTGAARPVEASGGVDGFGFGDESGSGAFTETDPVLVGGNAGVCVPGTVTEVLGVRGGPVGGVPVAVAVLLTAPASRSACVT